MICVRSRNLHAAACTFSLFSSDVRGIRNITDEPFVRVLFALNRGVSGVSSYSTYTTTQKCVGVAFCINKVCCYLQRLRLTSITYYYNCKGEQKHDMKIRTIHYFGGEK